MACAAHRTEDSPPGYRKRTTPGDRPTAWIHEQTGLEVSLQRYARHRSAQSVMPDHYEFRLVVRPGGSETGTCVDSTLQGFENATGRTPEQMARTWMRAHPDGRVDLAAEDVA